MKTYNKITPEGTRDLLFEECATRGLLIKRLGKRFRLRGYREVCTPVMEFYDLFHCSGGSFAQEDMYKLTDREGRLMVLRPDCTVPIARLVATRLTEEPLPLRLYYSEKVYRVSHNLRGRLSEIHQAGIELIGTRSLSSDLEMVELAAASLGEIRDGNYRIELCHIGYFKSIIDHLLASDEEKEEIRSYVEQKNYAALTDRLSSFPDSRPVRALRMLPRLFGGEEVFAAATELFWENGAKESLEYLESIYTALKKLGLGERVIIDLGLVNQAEYYTGLIFRGYLDGIGEPVLSGGRYDRLISDLGPNLPATGFAINIDLACEASSPEEIEPPKVLIFAKTGEETAAIEEVRRLNREDVTAEISTSDTLEEAVEYAKRRGICRIHPVGGESIRLPLTGKGEMR